VKNIFKIISFSSFLVMQLQGVLMIDDPSAPNVSKSTIINPVAKALPVMAKAPVVVAPAPKIVAPVVTPVATLPKAMPKIQPVDQPVMHPVMAQPIIAQPAVEQPVVDQPVAKTVVNPTMSNQIIGTVAVENRSKFPAVLTGFKTKYKDVKGDVHHKIHKLKASHTIPAFLKATGGVTTKLFTVSVNAPINSFVEGVSDLLIQGSPVSVEYKGSAWMPGTTDKLYITSTNGSDWTLDKAAMDKSYKKINSGSLDASDVKANSDDLSKITNTTKSAVTQIVLKDSNNKKKFKGIAATPKISKSAQSSKKALKSTITT
jgi:hypothetical protein